MPRTHADIWSIEICSRSSSPEAAPRRFHSTRTNSKVLRKRSFASSRCGREIIASALFGDHVKAKFRCRMASKVEMSHLEAVVSLDADFIPQRRATARQTPAWSTYKFDNVFAIPPRSLEVWPSRCGTDSFKECSRGRLACRRLDRPISRHARGACVPLRSGLSRPSDRGRTQTIAPVHFRRGWLILSTPTDVAGGRPLKPNAVKILNRRH